MISGLKDKEREINARYNMKHYRNLLKAAYPTMLGMMFILGSFHYRYNIHETEQVQRYVGARNTLSSLRHISEDINAKFDFKTPETKTLRERTKQNLTMAMPSIENKVTEMEELPEVMKYNKKMNITLYTGLGGLLFTLGTFFYGLFRSKSNMGKRREELAAIQQ